MKVYLLIRHYGSRDAITVHQTLKSAMDHSGVVSVEWHRDLPELWTHRGFSSCDIHEEEVR